RLAQWLWRHRGRAQAMRQRADQWMRSSYFVPFQFLDFFGYWPLFVRIWLLEDIRHWRHACMRAFCWIDFALDTIRLHKPEVGRRSQSTAKLYCLSHGTVFLRPRLKSLCDSRLK